MRRSTLTVALVVAAMVLVPIGGVAAAGASTAQYDTENETSDVAPGERLSGVVGVQEAELEGEVDSRAFGIQVARSASENATADVVAKQFDSIEQRLQQLEQRKEALKQARENGSISEGAYKAKMSELAARTQAAKDLANRSEEAAAGLPTELLESKGINASAIQTLKDRASELGGPEVAEIARSIAGPNVGKGVGAGPPSDAGSNGDVPGDKGGDRGNGPADNRTGPGNETRGNSSVGN